MGESTAAEVERLAKIYSKSRDSLPFEISKLVNAIVLVSATAPPTRARSFMPGYVSLRHIEDSLDRRMWAGFGCAKVAWQFLKDRHETGKRDGGFAPRRKSVSKSLNKAFLAGNLALCVMADKAAFRERYKQVPTWAEKPIPLPTELLGCIFVGDDHGRIPATFAIRPSRKLAGSDRLFAVLNCPHQLVVREVDFRRWLRSERRKGRWPSQGRAYATPKRNPVGRPRKLNPALKVAILSAGQENTWNGARPISELHRFLVSRGVNVPSVDTLARLVDALFAETGEPWLRRRRRVRRS